MQRLELSLSWRTNGSAVSPAPLPDLRNHFGPFQPQPSGADGFSDSSCRPRVLPRHAGSRVRPIDVEPTTAAISPMCLTRRRRYPGGASEG